VILCGKSDVPTPWQLKQPPDHPDGYAPAVVDTPMVMAREATTINTEARVAYHFFMATSISLSP